MKPASIVIVETNTDLRNSLRHAFETRGYLTWTCPYPEMAESILTAIQPDVVILCLDNGDLSCQIDSWKELAPHTCFVNAGPMGPIIEHLEKEHPSHRTPDSQVLGAAA